MNDTNFSLETNLSTVEVVISPDLTATLEFVMYGILLNVIGLMGIMGNIISIIILTRPQMRSSINFLLTALAKCDTVLILTSMFLFGFPALYKYTDTAYLYGYFYKIYPLLSPIIFPIATIVQTISVYLTMTVTFERFIAVCHPLRARFLCTYGRARLYVILVISFSILYNLCRFWEVGVSAGFDPTTNETIYEPVPTQLRHNRLYIAIYVHWLYLLFIYFIPFSFLAVLNTAIYRQVRKANRERQRLSRLQKKEIGLATMLLCVVFVFVLCNIFALVVNILEAFYETIFDSLVFVSNLLITINSSVNFIIYVIFGEKFKRLFLKLFCSRGPKTCLGGRESPDAGTMHEDSIMLSNGDGRTSMRSLRASNGSSKKVPRALPCVYYPTRCGARWVHEHPTVSTALNEL